MATKQEAATGAAEDEVGLGRIGAEEEEDEEVGGDGGGDGDWAATNLSLGQALKRLRALGKECAALAADKARLTRHLEQMEGTNFLVGAEKERLADEAAHLRAEVARLEKALREMEEDVEELRLAVKRAEDKAEAYHGALIKERQWHKVGELIWWNMLSSYTVACGPAKDTTDRPSTTPHRAPRRSSGTRSTR